LEEEIDLRPYIESLIKNWKWIVGCAVLTGVIAFVFASLQPPLYEATALVAVTNPTDIVEFDTRIRDVATTQPLKAYPELAISDALIQELLAEVSSVVPEIKTVKVLRDLLYAESGADPSILRLTTTYGDPDVTKTITNTWAELFVKKANDIYGDQGGEQLVFFEAQLEDARVQLETIEQNMIDFQADNLTVILGNRLNARQNYLADQLKKQRQISLLLQDIELLRTQINATDGLLADASADQLAVLLLQVRAYDGDNSQGSVPWQLQIDMTQLAEATSEEQLKLVDGLYIALSAQLEQINTQLTTELEPEILNLQQQKQIADVRAGELTRARDLSEQTFTALASKVEEERITSQDTGSGVRLASKASLPGEPISSGRILTTLVAAIFALMAGAFVVLLLTWWKSTESTIIETDQS
jgi:uncharacterized protein involved in exopolysaccharide biosynthesis